MREGRMRAEAVVGVIGADLQRAGGDHQAFAGEVLGEPPPAPGGVVCHLIPAELLDVRGGQWDAMNSLKAPEVGRWERLLPRSSSL